MLRKKIIEKCRIKKLLFIIQKKRNGNTFYLQTKMSIKIKIRDKKDSQKILWWAIFRGTIFRGKVFQGAFFLEPYNSQHIFLTSSLKNCTGTGVDQTIDKDKQKMC